MSFNSDTSRISPPPLDALPDDGPPYINYMSYRLPPPLSADVPPRAPAQVTPASEGHVIEVGGVRIPLGPGERYDPETDELIAADGRRVKRAALLTE